jgi:uncharacterized membrane protein required for colicin V production
MGLDVALGVIILIAAIRGWLQGFIYQAIRIGGLIACVYLATPVRDQVKPYILPYLPSIHPDWVDRLFWWVAAFVTYVVLVGTTTLALKMTKRPEIPGMPAQRSRNDQFAGFLFGILKGALIAAFVAAAIQKYALEQIETIPWAEGQFKSSLALQWNRQYRPASKIWRSVPVRHLVNHVQRMGVDGPPESSPSEAADKAGARPVVQTARKGATEDEGNVPRSDALPAPPAPPAATTRQEAAREVEGVLDEIKATVDAATKPK